MIKNSLLILLFSICIASCMTDADDQCASDDFDRGAMLNNWAENIIIPAYENYTNKLEDLRSDVVVFSDTPNQINLEKVRTSWLGAYIAWQKVALFQIGKAEVLRLRDYTNTYPLDAVGVENNIASDSFDLSLSTEMNKQGFPALDYLLNGVKDSDLEILNVYDNTSYKNYLRAVVTRLEDMALSVLQDWKTSYKSIFVANECSSATASVDKLTNDFIFNFEKHIRVAKIGKPIGFFNDNPVSVSEAAEAVEAFYKKDVSKELFVVAIQASRDFFSGKHFNSDTEGISLKSYLTDLNIKTVTEKSVSEEILERMDKALSTANGLEDNFYDQIIADRDAFVVMRKELHSVVEVLKTNMISALKIKADFNDTDGD
jgi:predicted lipoprotein